MKRYKFIRSGFRPESELTNDTDPRQKREGMTSVGGYLLLLALAFCFDLLFTMPPFLLHFGVAADLIYKFFQPVCHQMDARSFHLFGYKLAVCSRCASIYYGLTFGIAVYPFFRSLRNVSMPGLIYIAIPIATLAADFSVNFLGITQNTFLSRSITGGLLGVSTAFFFVPVWISLMREFSQGNHIRKKSAPAPFGGSRSARREFLINEK
ncbi:MAG TPA: DUF2085 domain-containing protein [Candidatus Acidoferrales bacterium]|nr:DUF2085 domain-containing protein [Candidatus Acidoferrales bacterium]